MGYENHPRQQAIVDHSGLTNIIVVGVPGQTIVVYGLIVVFDGDSMTTIRSGATPRTGPMSMLASGSIVLDDERHPWFICDDGDDFIIQLSPGVQISGRCYYTQSRTDTLGPFMV